MVARVRSWWQKIQIHPVRTVLIALLSVVVVLIILSILGYLFNWQWTGLVPETSEPKQHAKTLWDWLQLLFIPVVLAIAGFWFNHRERKAAELRADVEREIEIQRAEVEREIALDNQREATLQAYIDKRSELLLHEGLRDSDEKDEVRKIARVRTLSVLSRMDAKRKKNVMVFLFESELIWANKNNFKVKNIISLRGARLERADLSDIELTVVNLNYACLRNANLSRTHLRMSHLSRADLCGTNLRSADLKETAFVGAMMMNADMSDSDLRGADLSNANLIGSILRNADLSDANLTGAKVTPEQLAESESLKGATMPDGSIHP